MTKPLAIIRSPAAKVFEPGSMSAPPTIMRHTRNFASQSIPTADFSLSGHQVLYVFMATPFSRTSPGLDEFLADAGFYLRDHLFNLLGITRRADQRGAGRVDDDQVLAIDGGDDVAGDF